MATSVKESLVACNLKEKKNKRNYGIDLYKIFAMYMIVIFHILHQGGIISSSKEINTVNYIVSYTILVLVQTGVNCFALASGFVMINTKYKFSRAINLWLQVFFYCIVIAVVFILFVPGTNAIKEIVKSFFPVTLKQYWYFTGYFILLLFMPFINIVIKSISKKQYQLLVALLMGIFSIGTITKLPFTYEIPLGAGLTFWWLAILYVVGGYFGKYGDTIKIKSAFLWLVIVVCVLLTQVSIFSELLLSSSNSILKLLGKLGSQFQLISNDSPTILFISIALLILFSRINLKNKKVISVVSFISPLLFSIYLIHVNQLIFENILCGSCTKLAEMNTVVMVLAVLGISLAIFVVCIFIDYLRMLLFKLLKVNQRTEKLCDFVSKKIFKE